MQTRVPIESSRPIFVFGVVRLVFISTALLGLVVFDLPADGRALIPLGAAMPWSVGVVLATRRNPEVALHPLVVVVDFALVLLAQLLVPEGYGSIHFVAFFLIAVHSHLQGGDRSSVVALTGAVPLAVTTVLRGDAPVGGDRLLSYEIAFVIASLGTGIIVGRLRTGESASRLRARSLTRRTIEAEREVRRRVAEAIHDGPVQDLIGLDMVLSTARKAAERGDGKEVERLMEEAAQITQRNVRALRDEIVDLGPYAFEELTFDVALSNCLDTWKRRWDVELALAIEPVELSPETAADLFHITQEAVANAGRHGEADTVSISLRSVDGRLELRVADDGKGFEDGNPFALPEPGHLGITSMRERAELLDGDLSIETSERGTRLVLLAPLPGGDSAR